MESRAAGSAPDATGRGLILKCELRTATCARPAGCRSPRSVRECLQKVAQRSESKLTDRRYLYSHILAFRPILLHSIEGCDSSTKAPFGRDTMRHILTAALLDKGPSLCLQAAIELPLLIDLVRKTIATFYRSHGTLYSVSQLNHRSAYSADFTLCRHVHMRHGHTSTSTLPPRPPGLGCSFCHMPRHSQLVSLLEYHGAAVHEATRAWRQNVCSRYRCYWHRPDSSKPSPVRHWSRDIERGRSQQRFRLRCTIRA